MFEIFPWNPHLETGIALIDEQHRVLVGLLNRLAQQHVQGATEAEIHRLQLTDHTRSDWYSVTTQAPPRPRLCCSAVRAPGTWRAAALPRNWWVSS